MTEAKKTLLPEVQNKYNLTQGHGIGTFKFKGIIYELDQLNVKQVETLIANGYDGLTLKQPSPEAKVK